MFIILIRKHQIASALDGVDHDTFNEVFLKKALKSSARLFDP